MAQPTVLTRDQRIGRRAAVGLLATVAVGLIVGPFGVATNLFITIVTDMDPPTTDTWGKTVTTIWRGGLPIDVPWWAYLAPSVALGILLVVVWNPARHYAEFWRGKVILIASPNVFALSAFVWASFCFNTGIYYTAKDEWQGYLYIPVAVALAVAVVGCARGLPTRRPTRQRKARPNSQRL